MDDVVVHGHLVLQHQQGDDIALVRRYGEVSNIPIANGGCLDKHVGDSSVRAPACQDISQMEGTTVLAGDVPAAPALRNRGRIESLARDHVRENLCAFDVVRGLEQEVGDSAPHFREGVMTGQAAQGLALQMSGAAVSVRERIENRSRSASMVTISSSPEFGIQPI